MQDHYYIIRGGVGDLLPILNRIDGYKKANPTLVGDVHLLIGGYRNIPNLCKEIADTQPYIASCKVVKNFSQFNIGNELKDAIQKQHPNSNVEYFDVVNILRTGKANFESMPLQYTWEPHVPEWQRYKLPTGQNITTCGIQLATNSGAEDADHNGKRFLSQSEWIKIFENLTTKKIMPVFFGMSNDNLDIDVKKYGLDLLGKLSILQCCHVIKQVDYFIGTNSWMWALRAIAGLPTICTYFTNQFWCRLQIPENAKFLEHTNIIYEHTQQTVDSLQQLNQKDTTL